MTHHRGWGAPEARERSGHEQAPRPRQQRGWGHVASRGGQGPSSWASWAPLAQAHTKAPPTSSGANPIHHVNGYAVPHPAKTTAPPPPPLTQSCSYQKTKSFERLAFLYLVTGQVGRDAARGDRGRAAWYTRGAGSGASPTPGPLSACVLLRLLILTASGDAHGICTPAHGWHLDAPDQS
jgi:hypothetical protein